MSEVVVVAFVLHVATAVALTGLIWFVQIVHYPLFAAVGRREFAAYERQHVNRTLAVVGPLMLLEASTAPILLWLTPRPSPALWASAFLLLLIWIATASFFVPLHRRLETGWDREAGRRLVAANWIRTIAWTARSLLLLWTLAASIR